MSEQQLHGALEGFERPVVPDFFLLSDGASIDRRGVLRWTGPPMSRIGSMALLAMRDVEPSINLASWDFDAGIRLPELRKPGVLVSGAGRQADPEELTCPDVRPGKYQITGANLGIDCAEMMEGFVDLDLHLSLERVDERACRECGCTEDRACLGSDLTPCGWAERDLCTACEAAARSA